MPLRIFTFEACKKRAQMPSSVIHQKHIGNWQIVWSTARLFPVMMKRSWQRKEGLQSLIQWIAVRKRFCICGSRGPHSVSLPPSTSQIINAYICVKTRAKTVALWQFRLSRASRASDQSLPPVSHITFGTTAGREKSVTLHDAFYHRQEIQICKSDLRLKKKNLSDLKIIFIALRSRLLGFFLFTKLSQIVTVFMHPRSRDRC